MADSIRVRNSAGLRTGDAAWLGIGASTALVAAAVVFGLPMIGFLVGAAWTPGLLEFVELGVHGVNRSAALGGLLGLTIAIGLARYISTCLCTEHWLKPNLVKNASYER